MTPYPLTDVALANRAMVEALYAKYKNDPESFDPSWKELFKDLDQERIDTSPNPNDHLATPSQALSSLSLLANMYRTWGHLEAPFNPIPLQKIPDSSRLTLEKAGFHSEDLASWVDTAGLMDKPSMPLKNAVDHFRRIYCSRIGFEYMGLQRGEELEKWIQQKIEPESLPIVFDEKGKQLILETLCKAECFESFLHIQFPGHKRFSIEGAETCIPMILELLGTAGLQGADELVIGMAHRGRLNVLAHVLQKEYASLFAEFVEHEDVDSFEGTGDVKYHKGFFSDVVTMHGHTMKVTLPSNPSHLESVDGVVLGMTRGKQVKRGDIHQNLVVPLLIHGDGSLAGQGVVYESLQLSRLSHYSTGGTIHLVINNHIGFTTGPEEARSTQYCTDIAKAFGFPVFHLNAEDPESCVWAARLAMEIRNRFHIDVFLDLNCYRKYGHNEGDEPSFTQPLQVEQIKNRPSIKELYQKQLVKEGVVQEGWLDKVESSCKAKLQEAHAVKRPLGKSKIETKESVKHLRLPDITTLKQIGEAFNRIPESFVIHPKLKKLIQERLGMLKEGGRLLDWGMAELLAYASLIFQGVRVRLSGQDSARGTFSHRHAVWIDQKNGSDYLSLQAIKPEIEVANSPLSEYAVLGFEYGYSLGDPDALVIWEAQFGDFSNVAQVVIDQYIAAGEQKWGQASSLSLFLPHGYEGQGPEHSSARLERYLSLSGQGNWRVCYPTTPAQFFHLIRRQAASPSKKPLICMTPKVLLRHPKCVSALDELSQGVFQEIIEDKESYENASHLVFCSGKIYYDLVETGKKKEVTFVRIEQLYPLDIEGVKAILRNTKGVPRVSWVQEEPENMGAWSYIRPLLSKLLPAGVTLEYIGRRASASTAVGAYSVHKKELDEILSKL